MQNKEFVSRNTVLLGLIFLGLSFLIFGNGLNGDFVFDDKIVIVGNPQVEGSTGSFWNVFISPYHFNQPQTGLFRPLTIASYAANLFVFGNSSFSFHLVNVILHAAVVFLIYLFVRRMKNELAAIISSILFLVWPIHVESVTSIIGRAEILSLFFVLVALVFSLGKNYWMASIAFLLALLGKETAVAFLPILVFLEGFYLKISWPLVFRHALKFLPAAALYGILRWIALGGYFLGNDATAIYNPIKFADFWSGLATSFKVLCLYVFKIFSGVGFSSDYSFNQISLVNNLFLSPEALIGLGLFLIVIVLAVRLRHSVLGFGAAFFLFSYFVVSNWVFKIGTVMAERLMYMPSLGVAIVISAGLSGILSGNRSWLRKAVYFCLAAAVAYYGWAAFDRNRAWLNEAALFQSAFAAAPNSVVNMTNMAYLDLINKDYESAKKRIDEVLVVASDHAPALNLAGQIYKQLGEHQKAEELWKAAIKKRPDFLKAYLSLGRLYYQNGYFKSAEAVLKDALAVYSRPSEVALLSLVKTAQHDFDGAIREIEDRYGKEPSYRDLRFALGAAYLKKGEEDVGLKHLGLAADASIDLNAIVDKIKNNNVFLLDDF